MLPFSWLLDTPPLNPDGPTARHWLHQELVKPEYQAAKPTWFDRLAQQFSDWLNSLGLPTGDSGGWVIAVIGIALLAALVVGAFAIFGVPRFRRRKPTTSVFDAEDARTADGQRRDAEAAARAGRFDSAVLDLFRAIARSLDDRTIVFVLPGTTAQDVAALAAPAFPEFATRLRDAAGLFDGIRYLDRAAGAEDYASLRSLDSEVLRAKPVLSSLVGPGRVEFDGQSVGGGAERGTR